MQERTRGARTIVPADSDPQSIYALLKSLVVPRPIAWVSTVAPDGTLNLAPHSYFTIVSSAPPAVAFSSIGEKDTIRNLRATAEFVVHVVDWSLVQQMNLTSVPAPADVSELDLAGLHAEPATCVSAPAVAEANVAIECRVLQEVAVGDGHLVIGACVAFRVADHLFDDRGRVDPGRLDAVARMGGSVYATTRDRFELRRPRYDDVKGS